jgi:hypothetical protein
MKTNLYRARWNNELDLRTIKVLAIYPDGGHDTCDNTFSRDDIYAWLLQQHREDSRTK